MTLTDLACDFIFSILFFETDEIIMLSNWDMSAP